MYKDPVTGDPLSKLEYYTRKVQVYVRTPLFILGFNVITIVMLTHGQEIHWNDFASWLAVMIEWLVGTYMFGQTGRDALHIRHTDRVVGRIELMEERILSVVSPAQESPAPGLQEDTTHTGHTPDEPDPASPQTSGTH